MPDDLLSMIRRIWANGCPNCQTTRYLLKFRRPVGKLYAEGVECAGCRVTWEAEPMPWVEL